MAKKPVQSASISPRPNFSNVPWHSLGVGASVIGTPFGISYLYPIWGLVLGMSEFGLFAIVVAAALFGTSIISGRAFRLLDWLAGKSPSVSAGGNDLR